MRHRAIRPYSPDGNNTRHSTPPSSWPGSVAGARAAAARRLPPRLDGTGSPRSSRRATRGRVGPCLDGLPSPTGRGDRRRRRVHRRDGRSSRAAAARGWSRGAPPPGWVGKPWALQQGLEAATGDVVVTLDADTRPGPGWLGALAAARSTPTSCPRRRASSASRAASGCFTQRCWRRSSTASGRWTLGVRRADAGAGTVSARRYRRAAFVEAGGYARVRRPHDRGLRARPRRSRRRAGASRSRTAATCSRSKMHASAGEPWREWGRSLAMADVTVPAWRAADIAVVWRGRAAAAAAAASARAAVWTGAARAVCWRWALARSYRPRGRRSGCRRSPTRWPRCGSRCRRFARRGAGGGATTARRRTAGR